MATECHESCSVAPPVATREAYPGDVFYSSRSGQHELPTSVILQLLVQVVQTVFRTHEMIARLFRDQNLYFKILYARPCHGRRVQLGDP